MQDFERFLERSLPRVETFHPNYNEALSAMLLAGGKRFRPRLLLGIVDAYGPLLRESAMYAAAALELFHTYSLIHDDLPAMDDAGLRRGKPTLHTRFGDALAILAGDALNTHAFELLAAAPLRADVRIELVRILAENGGSGGMVLGQAIDLHFENSPLELEQVVELHRNKTAKLIAAALEMGAVIVGLDAEARDALYRFGVELGLLFQVQDDILDAVQSPEEAGKPTAHDGDKNSFVTLLGLEGARAYADGLAESLEQRFEAFDAPLRQAMKDLMERYLRRHTRSGREKG
ncbi:polyprenyl synthetase family protein [Nitratifractor sp.]